MTSVTAPGGALPVRNIYYIQALSLRENKFICAKDRKSHPFKCNINTNLQAVYHSRTQQGNLMEHFKSINVCCHISIGKCAQLNVTLLWQQNSVLATINKNILLHRGSGL